jgi:hypothetical protein
MKLPTISEVRVFAQTACPNPGKDRLTFQQLYDVFGVDSPKDRARFRRKLKDMVRRGELIRERPGVFRYNPTAADQEASEGYQRIWRAIRAQRPGWTLHDLAQVTRLSYSHARTYCRWLNREGYITRHGCRGAASQWRATTKAREQQTAPIPVTTPQDPFNVERNAACRLVRCLMAADPYRPHTRQKIVNEAQTILRRFQPAEGGDQ